MEKELIKSPYCANFFPPGYGFCTLERLGEDFESGNRRLLFEVPGKIIVIFWCSPYYSVSQTFFF